MTTEQLILLAAVAAGAAAHLVTRRDRTAALHRAAGDRPVMARLGGRLALLRPVPGAASPILRGCLAVIAASLVAAVLQPGGWQPIGVAAITGAGVFLGLGRLSLDRHGRDEARVVGDLPGVCLLLAVCLEAGLPLRNAVRNVADGLDGPVAGHLLRLSRAVDLGVPEPDAWAELAQRHDGYAGLAGELRHALDGGIALAPVLRHHAAEAERDARAVAQARARRTAVTGLLPLMVCFLPAFVLVGIVPIVGGVAGRLFG